MKTKLASIVLLMLIACTTSIHAQSYDKLWDNIKQAEQKDLPKTVISNCDAIIRKATKDHNSGQLLKAYFYRNASQLKISSDSIYTQIKAMESWAEETKTNATDRMIVHSVLAEIYANYAAYNSWVLKKRSVLNVKQAPEDIREWTSKQFQEALTKHIDASLADVNLLHATNTKNYEPFTSLKWASEFFGHDLLHLLGKRAIHSLIIFQGAASNTEKAVLREKEFKIMQMMKDIYAQSNDKDALNLLSIDELLMKYPNRNKEYAKALDRLMQTSDKSCNTYAELYITKAQYYSSNKRPAKGLELCNQGLQEYPKYERANVLSLLKSDILRPSVSISHLNAAYPGNTEKITVTHRNSKGFTYMMYLLPQGANVNEHISTSQCKLVYSKHFDLNMPKDYKDATDTFSIQIPEEGIYMPVVRADEKEEDSSNDNARMRVSRLKLLTINISDKQLEAVVVDGKTGTPIGNAEVKSYTYSHKLVSQAKTNSEGKAIISNSERAEYIETSKGSDKYASPVWIGASYEESERQDIQHTVLMTDRSIYRPGQTVYLKGICYTQKGDSTHVSAGKSFTLSLRDVNYQEIAQKKVKSNAYGSFTTVFTLPTACLNGRFSIHTDNAQTDFRVEEYKRPSFEVKMDDLKDSYSLGDSVTIKGNAKTFSGVPVDGAKIKYTVTRERWTWWWRQESTVIATNEQLTTAADGSFSFPIELSELSNDAADENEDEDVADDNTTEVSDDSDNTDEGADDDGNPSASDDFSYYIYRVQVDVTNTAGETQSGASVVAAGKQSLILKYDGNKRINKGESIRISFTAKNLLQKEVSTKLDYTLAPIKDKKIGDIVRKGTVEANKEMTMADWQQLSSGIYRLTLHTTDSKGRSIDTKQNIILFSTTDKQPADGGDVWAYIEKSNTDEDHYFDLRHPAKFYFGTARKDATVMMNIFAHNKRIENRTLHLSNEIKTFEMPYKAAYGDGIVVNFCFVKDNHLFQQDFVFKKSLPVHQLKMKWNVFRDKLRPGQKEEWRLNIQTPDGKPADAELMAYMYDASLDKLNMHSLDDPISFDRIVSSNSWQHSGVGTFSIYYQGKRENFIIKTLDYDTFNTGRLTYLYRYSNNEVLNEVMVIGYGRQTNSISLSKREHPAYKLQASSRSAAAAPIRYTAPVIKHDSEMKSDNAEKSASDEQPLRSNFAETAFFYPQLRTDAKGNVAIAFTLPESLTKWKFNSMAHTKDMFTGLLGSEVTASKDLMITPNMPRFVRTGDHTSIAATVANLTAKPITGKVKFELFDPTTDEVILTGSKPVDIAAKQSSAVNFDFTVTDRYDILGVRMIADAGTFSDGEQHILPVLSDRVTLTESVPLPIRGNQTRTFDLSKLFNGHSTSTSHRRLTVEYTGNPAWYAVQALPSLATPDNDNAISWATALYANSIAAHIANSMPRIKNIFDTWKAQGGNKETLMSNLQKNQELKDILLDESPWVLEAKNEQQQKERLGTLFDLNNIQNIKTSAINKLKQLQSGDGGWCWYKGMESSPYITEYVVRLMARLHLLTGESLSPEQSQMQQQGINFLHSVSQKNYEWLKKAEREGQKIKGVSCSTLRYLYLIAITDSKVPQQYQTEYKYFLSKVNDQPYAQDMQEKALAAIILKKEGKNSVADEYIQSLRQHLTQTDELGMFFDFNDNPFVWGSRHLDAHTAAIEAFDKVANDKTTVDEMNIWLLKQKQTQMWDSPVSTADAIYALLERGTDVLANKGEVHLTFAGQHMSTTDKGSIPGLSYIKQSFTDKAATDARTITVEKKDEGIAWGAVYATFSEAITNVKQQGTSALNVKKEIFVKHIVDNVPQLDAIKDKSTIHVGDVVVARLTIQTDRKMDFVQLKEQRGACFEPITVLSGYRWGADTGYYEEIKDASTNFFFDSLDKGVYILEINYRASRTGNYEVGLSTLQSAYAPEFATHSDAMRIEVVK